MGNENQIKQDSGLLSRSANCSTARETEEAVFLLDSVVSSLAMYANYWGLSETKSARLLKRAAILNQVREIITK